MKRYKFLIKPLFYIFSLTASSYMVLVIEKVSPSDFGKHQSLFVTEPSKPASTQLVKYDSRKELLKSICFDYKYGIIDSAAVETRISTFLSGLPPAPDPQIAAVTKTDKILLQRINE